MISLALAFGLAVLACGLYIPLARYLNLLDRPNERSSHRYPIARGGGAPMLVAFALAVTVAAAGRGGWEAGYVLLLASTLLLMLLGLLDDALGLSVRLRLGAYSAICLYSCYQLLQPVLPASGMLLIVLLLGITFAWLWCLNLYNFMDGIDGIAALQGACASGGAALLVWLDHGNSDYVGFCLLFMASQLGFLCWNWPPARLFMGDAGSVASGFLIGGLALLGAVQEILSPACWLVLMAVFITDASWTLGVRIIRGERFTQAHRMHAYQRLSRHWNSQLRVDLLLLLIVGAWLLPLAWAIQTFEQLELFLVILAYLPLLLAMAKIRVLT